MKNLIKKTLPLLLLLPVVLSCALVDKVKENIEKASPPKTITSSDNSCQVTVPGLWDKMNPSDPIILRSSYNVDDIHLMVLKDPKQDFAVGTTLDDYLKLVQDDVRTRVTDAEFSAAQSVRVGGYDGKEIEVVGTIEKLRIKYLYTTLATPAGFFRVITWTTPSNFEKARPGFVTIRDSFKVVSSGGTSVGDGDDDDSPPRPASPKPKR